MIPINKDLAKKLLRHIPTILVFVGLGALFIWGERTGWEIPKFSNVLSSVTAELDEGEEPRITKYSVVITGMT